MSATVLTHDFDVTSELQLQKEVMAWFCEQGDFTAGATNTYGSTAYWKDESFGIGVYQNNSYSNHTMAIGAVENPASVTSSLSNSIIYTVETDGTGVRHFKISAVLVKTESCAIVCLRNGSSVSGAAQLIILGDEDDALRGYCSQFSASYPGTGLYGYYTSVQLKKKDDTAFGDGQYSSITCRSDSTDPEGELLLTPFYALLKAKRMAPVLVPGLYAESGSIFPSMLTQFSAGGKTMLQVGSHIAFDIT